MERSPRGEQDKCRALLVFPVLELVPALAQFGGKDPSCRFAFECSLPSPHVAWIRAHDAPPARFSSAACSPVSNVNALAFVDEQAVIDLAAVAGNISPEHLIPHPEEDLVHPERVVLRDLLGCSEA